MPFLKIPADGKEILKLIRKMLLMKVFEVLFSYSYDPPLQFYTLVIFKVCLF